MHWVLSLRMLFWVHVLCRELWHQALICLKWRTYVGSWVAASAALRHCCTKYLPCLAVRQNALLAVTPVCSSSRESHLPSVLLTESSRDRSKLFKKKKKKNALFMWWPSLGCPSLNSDFWENALPIFVLWSLKDTFKVYNISQREHTQFQAKFRN